MSPVASIAQAPIFDLDLLSVEAVGVAGMIWQVWSCLPMYLSLIHSSSRFDSDGQPFLLLQTISEEMS